MICCFNRGADTGDRDSFREEREHIPKCPQWYDALSSSCLRRRSFSSARPGHLFPRKDSLGSSLSCFFKRLRPFSLTPASYANCGAVPTSNHHIDRFQLKVASELPPIVWSTRSRSLFPCLLGRPTTRAKSSLARNHILVAQCKRIFCYAIDQRERY